MKKLSIVIPCKNEEDKIWKTLDSILNQERFNINILDIIIADANSTDNTISIINSYKDKLNIDIVIGGLPSVGRNNGAKKTNSDYILFLDSDIELGSKMLYKLSKHLNGDYDMITTKISVKNEILPNFIYNLNHLMQKVSKYISPFCVGAFMCVKVDIFWQLGGFDEDVMFAEDFFLSKKIKPKRFKILNTPIYTCGRRFKKMGYWWMIKHFILCFTNRNNPNFFKRDFKEYWN
jgi:glycosyltransferase involved in cell wall biosynthesis